MLEFINKMLHRLGSVIIIIIIVIFINILLLYSLPFVKDVNI